MQRTVWSVFWSVCFLFIFYTEVFSDHILLFNTYPFDDFQAHVGFVLRDVLPDEKGRCVKEDVFISDPWVDVMKGDKPSSTQTLLGVSLITPGQGANFRLWIPEKAVLFIDKDRILPCDQSKIYVPKPSVAKDIGVVVLVALGTQYEKDAHEASDSPGTPCSSKTGDKESSGTKKAIDKMGMAAGLGLLGAQAKGELTGLKATFNVTGLEGGLKDAKVRVTVANAAMHKTVDVDIPVHMDAASLGHSGSVPTTTVNL